jgi:O-succinylbenzoic acid--CoA ligase
MKFGEIVVLLVQSLDVAEAERVCRRVLPKYWQPRVYQSVDKIPMTETGKIKRKVKG